MKIVRVITPIYRWRITLNVNGIHFDCQLDSGAQANIFSLNTINKLKLNLNQITQQTNTKLMSINKKM